MIDGPLNALPSARISTLGFTKLLLALSAGLALLVLTAGCAQTPPDPKEELVDWLNENPRTVGIVASADRQDKPQIWTLETSEDRANRVGKAAVADVFSKVQGDPLAMLGALLYSPGIYLVGAAWGGTVSDFRIIRTQNLSMHVSAAAMFREALEDLTIEQAIWERVVKIRERRKSRTTIIPIDSKQDADRALEAREIDGIFDIDVSKFGLAFEEGDEQDLRLRIVTNLYLQNDKSRGLIEELIYLGDSRELSEWVADDAKAFRRELDQAFQKISEQIEEKFELEQITNEDLEE